MIFFCTGLENVDRYVSKLARLIEDNEPALVVARADRLVAHGYSVRMIA